jgi:hypothetical protein
MKPIKPKYSDTIEVKWNISKRSKEIISQYAKYTKYEESELIDKLILDILEDVDFVEWLKARRYNKKINKLIFDNCPYNSLDEENTHEEDEENCDF